MSSRACLTFFLVELFGCLTGKASDLAEPAFGRLTAQLIADGWDSVGTNRIFQDHRVQFIPALIPLNLVTRDVPDAYQGFLTRAQVRDGYEFLLTWRPQIAAALSGTGISVEIAVAMLKVESDLGMRPGGYPILSAFASIALLEDSLHWVAQFDTSGGADLERLEKRAIRRSKWAYQELNYFLELCALESWDPLEVKGSWAGAFGWAQFLPSSYLRCARDGDGDGKVDPFSLKDAVASLAYYLKDAGWRSGVRSQRRALLLYNPSGAYADCILEYAQRLREMGHRENADEADYYFGK